LIAFIGWIQKKITDSDTWSQHFSSFFFEIDSLLNWKIFSGFLITIVIYAIFFLSCYCMGLSLEITLSYYKTAVFVAIANILSFLPISFAGIGTREVSLVYLFSLENLSSEAALAFSTLLFAFTYLFAGIIGFFCFITIKHNTQS